MDLIPRKFYLDDIFDDFLTTRSDAKNMKCDIYEKGDNYHIEMDIPGFDKKDIKVETNDGYLTITAEREDSTDGEDGEGKEKKYIHRERSYGKYQRSFYLGNIDSSKIDASFNNGMLKVVIPKKGMEESKKSIEIK